VRTLDIREKRVERILLIRLRNIGDVLLMVPTIRSFREAFPKAYLAALVNAGTEEMLSGNPLLDEILVFDPRWKALPLRHRVVREGKFLREVRRRKFDLTINMTEGDRGAFLCLASGARYKVGLYHPDRTLWWKRRIYDQMVRIPDWRAHIVEQNLEFARSLGLHPRDTRLAIYYSAEDDRSLTLLLEAEGIQPGDTLVHVHPTSRWLFKCWRDDGVARVIDELTGRAGVRVVLTSGGGEKEIEKIGRIVNLCRTPPANLAGRTSLKQLAALSARARLFIGVDTAPMHIAAAVGTPVIALFGPSGEFNWGPWGPGHRVIKKDFTCRPCGEDGCQGSKKSRCLDEISAEEVLTAAFHSLALSAPAASGELL
jgi:heptosyltransferase-3